MKQIQDIAKDRDLLLGLARSDGKSLEIIYSDNFPVVLRMILQHNGTEDDAKDVFQEAIIILYEKACKGDFTLTSRLKTFLYSVCRHLWLKKLQSNHGMYALPTELEEIIPAEEIVDDHEAKDEQFRIMEKAMDSLGQPCKTILEDYYLHKHSMQEIAEKFGYTSSENAKNQKYKCLMRLKKMFFDKYNTSL
ncbi:RNA polymerase sigma factor, sigma-70 family [Chitinophaga jiangningensis]|uniref:RNA polymerase sigma factor, sigma-70 family n=1 Tax=Chitinophaga jiangningensis TaxID=1419482 RepID=A0A1M7GBJ6_9BACT|nr:sigma-70 family RNA polymerase sigma factor [Chitinophaga jiangningensis]SHM13670.1 RNA polymerase sigma factor, sigma-70 family [Chitinophaga jiangningensis]